MPKGWREEEWWCNCNPCPNGLSLSLDFGSNWSAGGEVTFFQELLFVTVSYNSAIRVSIRVSLDAPLI